MTAKLAPRPAPRYGRALLALAALFLAGESGLRVWDNYHEHTGSLYQYVVPVGARFKMKPATSVVVPERYGDIVYRFNRAGYRDVDHDPASPRRRIVWLGDSVSFGLGVERERTFVGRLARALDERYGPRYEIVNLAIFAYDTRHELQALADDGLEYRPGLVVVQFYMNDLNLAPPPRQAAAASWGDRLTAARNRILYASALYRRVHQAATGLGYLVLHNARRRYFPGTLNADEPRADRAYLAARRDDASIPTFAALVGIAELAHRHGARLLVVISPDEVQLFDPSYDLINQRVGDFCRRQGIEVFDPLPALRAAADRAMLFYDGVHYSERGHARLARLLLAELVGRRLLPG